jgi:4-hydroxy-4-methyl-2-oxoglutarate aldolase
MTTLARLRRLDCCALSDALDSLGLKGAVTGLRQESGNGRIAGRAITVKVGIGSPPPGPPRHLGTAAIEAGEPDNVIVIEQRSGLDAGCWGGLLTLGAQARGIAGVIADGPVRDIDEARTHGFPIFANRTTCLTARGRVVELGTNVPVTIGDVPVHAGDYVVADNSGVIVVRPDDVQRVIESAERIVAREAAMARAIAPTKPISAILGGDYEHLLDGEDA